jgi:hypothetical protein
VNINTKRLSDLAALQNSVKTARRNRDTSALLEAGSTHNALKLQELTREITAAYGPTLQYMQGMDEYA